MIIRFKLWALGIATLVLAPNVAHACECVGRRESREVTIAREFKLADAVFAGRVVRVGPRLEPEWQHAVVFRVDRVWKGDSVTTHTIYTADVRGTCGFDFIPGQHYLVFAENVPVWGGLATSICMLTTATKKAGDILAVIGDGTPVDAVTTAWWRRRDFLLGGALPVFGGALAVATN